MLVMSGGYASAVNEAQNLQAQLSKIGVKLTIDQQPTNVYVKRWSKADFDVALALNGGMSSPYLMYARYFGDGASLAKPAGLDSPPIAKLLAQAGASTEERLSDATVAQLQRTMLQQSPWVWLFTDNNVVAMQPNVTGLGITADNSLRSLQSATRG
jgi:peptide/nickel transport system substrate-binding protein